MSYPIIEKNIPIPAKSYPSRFYWTEFLKKLDIGDSFTTTKLTASRSASYKIGIELTFRKIGTGKEKYRVWRIK